MTKETTKATEPTSHDIIVPAHDTPDAALTPIVLDAMKHGATSRAHETDAASIIITIADKDEAGKFQAAINTVLKPKG